MNGCLCRELTKSSIVTPRRYPDRDAFYKLMAPYITSTAVNSGAQYCCKEDDNLIGEYVRVAQSAEHLTFNQRVEDSSSSTGTPPNVKSMCVLRCWTVGGKMVNTQAVKPTPSLGNSKIKIHISLRYGNIAVWVVEVRAYRFQYETAIGDTSPRVLRCLQ